MTNYRGYYARPSGEGCFGEFEYFPWFGDKTPIGGRWDIARDAHGITAGVGVHFDGAGKTRDDLYLQRLDAVIDDGATATQSVALEWVTTSTMNTMGHRARRTARTRGR
jgi:hypothetical protein